jgi:hypothetical protein
MDTFAKTYVINIEAGEELVFSDDDNYFFYDRFLVGLNKTDTSSFLINKVLVDLPGKTEVRTPITSLEVYQGEVLVFGQAIKKRYFDFLKFPTELPEPLNDFYYLINNGAFVLNSNGEYIIVK